MKMNKLGLSSWLLVTGVLSIARSASAERFWIQQPGKAKEIAVASNDMPWIVDTNGVIQYGTKEISCGFDLCIETGNVEWHVLGPGTAAHVAVGMDNLAYITDAVKGDMWLPVTALRHDVAGLNGWNWFNSFSAGWFNQPTKYPNGTRACIGRFAASADADDPERAAYYGVGCDNQLYHLIPEWFITSGHNTWFTHAGTSGAKQISLFSQVVSNEVEQAPWVLLNDAHLHAMGNDGTFHTIEVPRWSSGKAVPGGVIWATDRFAIAGNFVWRWTQDVWGGTGDARTDWDMYIGTTPKAPLAQIAYSGALPPPSYYGNNWVGPSRLWALDTAGNIYVMGEI